MVKLQHWRLFQAEMLANTSPMLGFSIGNVYVSPFVVSLSTHSCAYTLIQLSSPNPSTSSGRTVGGFEKLPILNGP